jgi:DNA-binding transcriptional regulator PaaX
MNDTYVSDPQEGAPGRWLLLLHQLPVEPAYIRVKVRRRLTRLGAVLLKNSVYALPNPAEHL